MRQRAAIAVFSLRSIDQTDPPAGLPYQFEAQTSGFTSIGLGRPLVSCQFGGVDPDQTDLAFIRELQAVAIMYVPDLLPVGLGQGATAVFCLQ